jgi:hypothetical protein
MPASRIRNILHNQSFRGLGPGARLKEIHQQFDEATPDLLIRENRTRRRRFFTPSSQICAKSSGRQSISPGDRTDVQPDTGFGKNRRLLEHRPLISCAPFHGPVDGSHQSADQNAGLVRRALQLHRPRTPAGRSTLKQNPSDGRANVLRAKAFGKMELLDARKRHPHRPHQDEYLKVGTQRLPNRLPRRAYRNQPGKMGSEQYEHHLLVGASRGDQGDRTTSGRYRVQWSYRAEQVTAQTHRTYLSIHG